MREQERDRGEGKKEGSQMEKEKAIICSVSFKPLLTCARIIVQF